MEINQHVSDLQTYKMATCGHFGFVMNILSDDMGQIHTVLVTNSPRARRLLFNPECAYVCKVVSIVEFYAEFKYARLTKIGCWVNSRFRFKEGYPL